MYISPVIEDIYLIDLKWQLLSVDAGRRSGWIILDDDSEYYYWLVRKESEIMGVRVKEIVLLRVVDYWILPENQYLRYIA